MLHVHTIVHGVCTIVCINVITLLSCVYVTCICLWYLENQVVLNCHTRFPNVVRYALKSSALLFFKYFFQFSVEANNGCLMCTSVAEMPTDVCYRPIL